MPPSEPIRSDINGGLPPWPAATIALMVLAVLAVLYTVYFAADFLIPITAAIVLNLVLSPIPRYLARFRVPAPVSAAAIVIVLIGGIAGGVYGLAAPAGEWMSRAPTLAAELRSKLADLRYPVERIKRTSEQVEQAASLGDPPRSREVVLREAGLLERLFGTLQVVLTQVAVTFVLLFFLLASGEMFKEKLVRVTPRFADKKRAVLVMRDIERDVSAYLFTITLINIGLGIAIGTALYFVGMPNAPLWGAMATILNYIPYIGALIGIVVVAVVGLSTLDTLAHAMMAPAIYVVANILESQFVTPAVLGRRLTLNPVIIFVAVAFWGWIWGVPGALLAVPLLVTLKVLSDHVPRLARIGEFLGGRRTREPPAAAEAPEADVQKPVGLPPAGEHA